MKHQWIGTRLLAALLMVSAAGCHWGQRDRDVGGRRTAKAAKLSDEQRTRLAEANGALSAGDYQTALAMFQDLLAENPTIAPAHIGVGEIFVQQKDYSKAEPHFAMAAKLEPRNFDAQYGHALALQMLQRFVDAVRAYHRALTIDPDNLKANLNLAVTYLQMDEAHSAVTFAQRAVAIDGGSGAARANLGAAYERVGRNADAIEQYTAALELVDDPAPLMMNLINVLAAEKRYQEAVNTAENLIRMQPSANAHERLGWCYFKLSEFDKSLNAYRDAVQVDREHWPSHNGIGVNAINRWILSKRQDDEARREARDAFRRSLRINPDQPKLVTLMSNYGL